MDVTPELTEEEMVEILKDLARNSSNGAARIAAIKTLREIRSGETSTADGFAGLYDVSNPGRVRTKKAS